LKNIVLKKFTIDITNFGGNMSSCKEITTGPDKYRLLLAMLLHHHQRRQRWVLLLAMVLMVVVGYYVMQLLHQNFHLKQKLVYFLDNLI